MSVRSIFVLCSSHSKAATSLVSMKFPHFNFVHDRFPATSAKSPVCDQYVCTVHHTAILVYVHRPAHQSSHFLNINTITPYLTQWCSYLSSTILASKGSSQPSVHSQWASRNVITCPFTCFAPRSLARIKPDRFSVLRTWTGTGNVDTWSSNCFPKCSERSIKFKNFYQIHETVTTSGASYHLEAWSSSIQFLPLRKQTESPLQQ
jgi:hypothetical protein